MEYDFLDVFNLLNSSKEIKDVKNNDDLKIRDFQAISDRNETYNRFLESYVDSYSSKAKSQRYMKWLFLLVILFLLGFLVIILSLAVYNFSRNENNVFDLASVISAIAGILTSFIIIPKIIAKNLFPSNEEDASSQIFNDMLNYDNSLRGFYKNTRSNYKHGNKQTYSEKTNK